MAAYDLEEQEQLAEIKAWWNQYGGLISTASLVVALGVAGWQGWGWYQRNEAAKASSVFSVLQESASRQDGQRLKAAGGELLEKYSSTPYASMGALITARSAAESGDLKSGRAQLQWVMDHGDEDVRELARWRLAGLLLDEKSYDEALRLVDGAGSAAMAPRFAELKGDILLAQGKRTEARASYESAIARIDEAQEKAKKNPELADPSLGQVQLAIKSILQQKLDASGPAQ